jgi:hypothetical protein
MEAIEAIAMTVTYAMAIGCGRSQRLTTGGRKKIGWWALRTGRGLRLWCGLPPFNKKFGDFMEIAKIRPRSKLKLPQAPKYLKPATRKWWRQVLENYELAEHHVKLLTLAASAWDRAEQSRQALAEFGLTYVDEKLNRLLIRPEVAVERDSRIAFARLLRELDLDTEPGPSGSRPPAIKSNRR